MTKYIVVSHDADEQQSFFDVISAETPEKARAIVANVREYAETVDTLTLVELAEFVRILGLPDAVPESSKALAVHLNAEYYDEEDGDRR